MMTTVDTNWQDTDLATLLLLRENLRKGLRAVAAHLDAGTFDKVPPGKASPPSQSGQLTAVLFLAVEAELAHRREAA